MLVQRNQARRKLLQTGGLIAASVLIPAVPPALAAEGIAENAKERFKELLGLNNNEEVTPPEDLMREHGVLDRVLLIYEAAIKRLDGKEDFDPAVITDAANVIKDFIEDYHEKSEENFLFPRFRKAGTLVDLVDTLKQQHDAGRAVTTRILQLAPQGREDERRPQLITSMQAFIAMYRPHAAREDTELFPQLRNVVSGNEYDSIAEEMEKQEHQKFGEDGFEKMTAHVAEIERRIGINDLNQFTPRV
jgi:hemerythrin-like domain-containing protein